MEYIHSEEFKTKMEKRMRICLAVLDLRGEQDASNKEYNHSIVNYRMLEPSNPTWVIKRSLCEARMGLRNHALVDAQKCIRLKPDLPVPYHGEIANEIVKKFLMPCLALPCLALPSRWNLTAWKPVMHLELVCLTTLFG
ncbi:uncharacterized protein LOC121768200 isoform X2 [Salvia splendens]|uniref:uncharacterized protein LOC121768200 isoform X2 n=1 Tax=Salvia splendens TaxID=180675 RepID=UPI001C25BD5C|nr:uncharacterized protein LOC121768200 isoform X2 [Salvia splendens]